MLFALLKSYARFCIRIYCRKIVVNKPEMLHIKGPVLFAANHPNSFLDGIILTTILEEHLWSLARGDAFRNPQTKKLLHWLHLLPVYRTSEGVENLSHNYTTFESCLEVFRKDGLVMIFSEGRCINEWHLRPLKKGTARLALSAWQSGIELQVVPLGFNYNTFRNFGKNVFLHFGEPLQKSLILQQDTEGKQLLAFNEQLKEQLEGLVYEIDGADRKTQVEKLYVPQSTVKRILLALPALAGLLTHAPLYFAAKKITATYFDNDHFDSVVAALVMLAYLLYLPLLCVAGGMLWGWKMAIVLLVLLPFCAWACVQLKPQLD